MTYDEYCSIIENSEVSDWQYDDEHQSYLYFPDISITMQARQEDEWKDFYEEWVENFPDTKAYRHVIEFYYFGRRIDDFYTALVDGNRMCIPYPKHDTRTITRRQYNLGRIINIPYCDVIDRYDEYLKMAKITVE